MQRFYRTIIDLNGNPASGCTCTVYLTGTTTLASLFEATSTDDTPATGISNPIVTGSDGKVAFAAADGDYDLVFAGSNITPETWRRYNMFDSTTATTVPVSSISLTMPTSEFDVTGSPGTSLAVTWDNQSANRVFAGPTSGAPATPAFRALVAADLSSIAVDKSTTQVAIGGDKTFTGAMTFSGAVSCGSTLGVTGAATFSADCTFGTNVDLVLDKTGKGCIGSAGTYGWRLVPFQYRGATGATAPTTNTVFQGGIYTVSFSAAAANNMYFALSLPHDYAEGTDVIPYVTWTTTGTDTGTVRWGLDYTLAKAYSQATPPANVTAYVETAGSGIALRPVTSSWAAISGTNLEAGAILIVRLWRDATHPNDSQADASLLIDFGLKYQTSRPFGSKNSTPNFYT